MIDMRWGGFGGHSGHPTDMVVCRAEYYCFGRVLCTASSSEQADANMGRWSAELLLVFENEPFKFRALVEK